MRWLLAVVPGALLIYAGLSSGVIVPALSGALLAALGVFSFANVAVATVRLDAGTLRGRTLLGRVAVPVDEITRIVPINLRYRRSLWTLWNRSSKMF